MPKLSNPNIRSKKNQIKQLEKEIKRLEKLSKKRLNSASKEIKALIRQVKTLAKKSAMEPQEITALISTGASSKTTPKARSSKPRKKVAPKYRDPQDKNNLWAGRGRKPKWVEAHLNSGGKLEGLLIEAPK